MSTGLTPTSSAVGMFEPVTMTRSAVAAALDAGTRFPCASRATGAGAPGEGEGEGIAATCAGTSGIMAKKIASRTALLRNNPHSESWALFIYLFSLIRRILKTPASVQFFFYFFFTCADVPIITTTTNQRSRHSEYSWCSMLFGGRSEISTPSVSRPFANARLGILGGCCVLVFRFA